MLIDQTSDLVSRGHVCTMNPSLTRPPRLPKSAFLPIHGQLGSNPQLSCLEWDDLCNQLSTFFNRQQADGHRQLKLLRAAAARIEVEHAFLIAERHMHSIAKTYRCEWIWRRLNRKTETCRSCCVESRTDQPQVCLNGNLKNQLVSGGRADAHSMSHASAASGIQGSTESQRRIN